MGRHYYGDIEGKFWFGTQPSNAGDRFGQSSMQPQHLEYYYEEAHLESVEAEIKVITETLGDWLGKLDKFFEETSVYNDEIVTNYGLDLEEFNLKLKDYADLRLGVQIRDCIKELGYCNFDAEC